MKNTSMARLCFATVDRSAESIIVWKTPRYVPVLYPDFVDSRIVFCECRLDSRVHIVDVGHFDWIPARSLTGTSFRPTAHGGAARTHADAQGICDRAQGGAPAGKHPSAQMPLCQQPARSSGA